MSPLPAPSVSRPPSGSVSPSQGYRPRRSKPCCQIAVAVAAADAGVSVEALLSHSRSTAPVALARQLAMYLAHVGLGLPQASVAAAFGRDRSTVAHACRRIEELRDAAPFDHKVGRLEACLRWAAEA
ncbi:MULTISPECIES: helix-turn-helix domain-containing protein [Xanthobacter]|jgi:hypothetical protein|uniref:helix-turn-helix domain-containing protein n=1 Tax=Xanthobacter TaxID=279 RepID=UPI001AE3C443|nr:helix-turn-helix domain-containing protein [Xanthobacter flavus]MBP2149324.1 hypothetical protein [Xanthobacter flavus]